MKTKPHPILSARSGHSGGKTLNRTIHRRLFALGLPGILFISVCVLSPSPAQAQCKQWDVTGKWAFQRSDGGTLYLDLQQHGTSFAGAIASTPDMTSRFSVNGNIYGNDFYMQSNSSGSGSGTYRGTVGPQGRIDGSMHFTNWGNPNTKYTWFSISAMKCADAAAPIKPTPDPRDPKNWSKPRPNTLPTNTSDANDPNRKGRGFINGLPLGTPTPTRSVEADESSSDDTQDQHKKKKKNKKKHHHHDDDDQNQGND